MSNQRENVEHESVNQEEQETATGATEGPAAEGGEDIQARLADLEELADRRRDQLLRAQAELENQRRRFERELEAAHKYAMERFAAELLTVCDSLEMGLEAARKTEDAGSIIEGTELTLKAFRKAFDKFGIEPVDPTGERFDPERHQAMTTQESTEHPPNTVLMTMQKGYLLQGRVLRPAMVIVSRAPEESPGGA
ncbi:Heat shock protein GrpE [Thioalkalivibrio nitratireducens DSM 14787]|uniref:Protein GrpE n=1 Tax=Thioalkalivibrio nitratireducens (strain DSM 14787 / UNIQEM 213 / ALEN2) TaxID=1255043 RepID=L0DYX7_THIND|nr:nucleotide exchange factor GrpE [Thioalkalivibrio nitratireducens]AGA34789.1 Heat shock protein GrpE [Thioalkalivibrio nitratireducens DSM 14787]